jgi:hypothetical protein
VTAVTVQTNVPANRTDTQQGGRVGQPQSLPVGARPMHSRRRTERMVMLRSATPGVQLVTLRHSVPLRLGALAAEDLTATPKVDDAERVLETTAGKGGDAR